MRKLSSYIGRYWYGYVFAVASMVTAIALDMLYPKITQKIVDDVYFRRADGDSDEAVDRNRARWNRTKHFWLL